MTMYLFTGTPGSGKSLHAADKIRNQLKYRRKPVIANFPANVSAVGVKQPDLFHFVDNQNLTFDFLRDFSADFFSGQSIREDEILLVIDEAQLIFNSRLWQEKDRLKWLEFFSQHRHFGYRVILCAQTDRMLDRQIRTLAEYECNHRKLSSFGFGGRLISLLFGGQVFGCVTYYYGTTEKVGMEYFLKRKSLYKMYDTFTLLEVRDGNAASRGRGAAGSPRPHEGACSSDSERTRCLT